jgi:DNA-directed RNA polymerase specialized sigma24 family protein
MLLRVGARMTDDLRERFERLIPELEERAAQLVTAMADAPSVKDLVEATWRVVCSKRSVGQLRAVAMRELECCGHNLILRRRFDAGDIDGAFAHLLPHLRSWAQNLTRGLAAPRPDPDDLVQDAFVKPRKSKLFAVADNPLGYAFRAVKNLVIDHARRKKPDVELADRHAGVTELETSPERLEAIFTRAGLDAKEKCMLSRVVFEKLAVGAAQKECGGPSGAPYYVFEKILDKVAVSLGIARSRP